MKLLLKILKWVGICLGGLFILAILLPLIWPVPPLSGIESIDQLKDPDSRFIDLDGITVHYKQAGSGEPYIILMHGFGASIFSWRNVIEPLGEFGTVIAYDRPASGLTDRPWKQTWHGMDPYGVDGQVEMLVTLMNSLNIPKAILVGNSAGGTIATYTALEYPERVQGIIEVDAAIYQQGNPIPSGLRWLLFTPEADRIGPLLARSVQKWGVDFLHSAWHNPNLITPEILAGYQKPLHIANWDKGLFELIRVPTIGSLVPRLKEIQIPTLVITGDDDRIVPTQSSKQLAAEISQAMLIIIPNCGHLPQEEQPLLFLNAVEPFILSLKK
jgi:pimeloyl-ACP methyl ester carboxylesterase